MPGASAIRYAPALKLPAQVLRQADRIVDSRRRMAFRVGGGARADVTSKYPACLYANGEALRKARPIMRAVHFVRFDSLHDQAYANAVRVFGPPHFLHRLWDNRAGREIADGDLVVFAKGDSDQPFSPYNGDDEFYCR